MPLFVFHPALWIRVGVTIGIAGLMVWGIVEDRRQFGGKKDEPGDL